MTLNDSAISVNTFQRLALLLATTLFTLSLIFLPFTPAINKALAILILVAVLWMTAALRKNGQYSDL